MGQNESPILSAIQEAYLAHGLPLEPSESSCQSSPPPNEIELSMDSLEEKPICRICHCSNEDVDPIQPSVSKKKSKKSVMRSDAFKFDINDPFFLITPCFCTGTLQYVHHKCLQQWIRSSNHKYCELCKYNFKLKTKNKPFYKWEFLNMSRGERRKLLFHISFNLISMMCVFWSIYVIAERAVHELSGQLGWRFWIKMLVVTIGFVCGIMFIFFQLKLYISIMLRWKQYNQIIIIENVNHQQSLSKHESRQSTLDLSCLEGK